MKITTLTNQDKDFYPVLGPFLARREVVAAVGGPVWDEDGKVWFVAQQGKKVVGFAALEIKGQQALFCSDYAPEQPNVAAALLEVRLAYLAGKATAATAVVNNAEIEEYAAAGFHPCPSSKPMKNYTKMERSL